MKKAFHRLFILIALFVFLTSGCSHQQKIIPFNSKPKPTPIVWQPEEVVPGTDHLVTDSTGGYQPVRAAVFDNNIYLMYALSTRMAVDDPDFNNEILKHKYPVYGKEFKNGEWQVESELFRMSYLGPGPLSASSIVNHNGGFEIAWSEKSLITVRRFQNEHWNNKVFDAYGSADEPTSPLMIAGDSGKTFLMFSRDIIEEFTKRNGMDIPNWSTTQYFSERNADSTNWSKPTAISKEHGFVLYPDRYAIAVRGDVPQFLWTEEEKVVAGKSYPNTYKLKYKEFGGHEETILTSREEVNDIGIAVDHNGSVVTFWRKSIRGKTPQHGIYYQIKKNGSWSRPAKLDTIDPTIPRSYQLFNDRRGGIYLFSFSSGGISYRTWNGSSWQSEVVLTPSAVDSAHPFDPDLTYEPRAVTLTARDDGTIFLFYIKGGRLILRKGIPVNEASN